jgi:hypothetical protein
MPTTTNTPAAHKRDVLQIDPSESCDTTGVTIDRELIDELDCQCASVSRGGYLEMVLTAAMARQHPHLAVPRGAHGPRLEPRARRCWQDRTTYDPTTHRAATPQLAAEG